MIGEYDPESEAVFEYYLINGEDLARVRYDRDMGEPVEGAILDESGEWSEYPVSDILMDGEEITEEEAEERAMELGGTLWEA